MGYLICTGNLCGAAVTIPNLHYGGTTLFKRAMQTPKPLQIQKLHANSPSLLPSLSPMPSSSSSSASSASASASSSSASASAAVCFYPRSCSFSLAQRRKLNGHVIYSLVKSYSSANGPWVRLKNDEPGKGLHLKSKCSRWMQHPFFCTSWQLFSTSTAVLSHGSDLDEIRSASSGVSNEKKFVVVVESAVKAKTIEKYLGSDFTVLPTYGHVRDLAARAGSVRPDDEYAMVWEVPEAAQPHVAKIKNALKGAKSLVLASDPDREGEAIAWHVSELMKADGLLKNKKIKVTRVTFNEITRTSVLQAMQLPRDISLTLVNAYLARRALDHLIGFALSPVLWRKLPGSRSAGRVQSAALRLVCERENEIEEFTAQEYWTTEAFACRDMAVGVSSLFRIRPTYYNGNKIEQFTLSNDSAKLLSDKLMDAKLKVSSVKKSLRKRNPPPPYMTSTLQQDAQIKLGFGASRTMTLAQKLYEGVKLGTEELTGLITYMRTDGLDLAKEAVQNIRSLAAERYGDKYVPTEARKFTSKVKNAQEAHEAIRPTDVYRLPSSLTHVLERDSLSLYTLIWKRTMACQMEQAVYDEVSVDFITEDEAVCARANSSYVSFSGFLAVIEDKQCVLDSGDEQIEEQGGEEGSTINEGKGFPSFEKGDTIVVKKVDLQQHFTRPPPRYSEGLLVKAMEELGIGRPSTYAPTLRTLQTRKYVKIENHRIIPEFRGRMVTAFLSHYFPKFVDYSFTADLEAQLDEVSGGHLDWKQVLAGFWPPFHEDISTVMKIPIQTVVEMMQETFATQWFKGLGTNGCICPNCGLGKLTLKLSRYGSGYFFGCDSYPDCSFKAEVLSSDDLDSAEDQKDSQMVFKQIEHVDNFIGLDPNTNLEIRAKKGPFGYYLQLGEDGKRKQFFKIPVGVNPAEITLEKAIQLMKYPLMLGKHPDDGDAVVLGIGKKSYFIRHRSATVLVPKDENIEGMNLGRAVELLKGKDVKRRGRKSLVVLAAEEKERNLAQLKRTAKYLKQSNGVKDKASDMADEKDAKKTKAISKLRVDTEGSMQTAKAKRLTSQKNVKVLDLEEAKSDDMTPTITKRVRQKKSEEAGPIDTDESPEMLISDAKETLRKSPRKKNKVLKIELESNTDSSLEGTCSEAPKKLSPKVRKGKAEPEESTSETLKTSSRGTKEKSELVEGIPLEITRKSSPRKRREKAGLESSTDSSLEVLEPETLKKLSSKVKKRIPESEESTSETPKKSSRTKKEKSEQEEDAPSETTMKSSTRARKKKVESEQGGNLLEKPKKSSSRKKKEAVEREESGILLETPKEIMKGEKEEN